MAITVRNKGQTVSTATNTISTVTPLVGNILVSFFDEVNSTAQPTVADNLGSTGWVVQSTAALFGSTANRSCWVAIKTATGGEGSITWTVGTGGTAEGVSYFELNGASTNIDTIVGQTVTGATAITVTSAAFSTTDSGGIILAACGQDGASGGNNAWTGTGPLININATSSRIIAGSFIPGAQVSGATVTANWTSSNHAAILVLALKAASITPQIGYIFSRPPFFS